MLFDKNSVELNLSDVGEKIKAYEEEISQLKNQLEETQSQLESWWLRCKIHRIPFIEISQVKRTQPKDWQKSLLGFGLGTPKEGELWDIETLEFKGWILGKHFPIRTLEIFLNQKLICVVSVDLVRPYITEKFKDIDYAKNCGFDFAIKTETLLSKNNDLEILANLDNEDKVKIFDIKVKKRLTESIYESIKQPALPSLVINYLEQNSNLFLINKDHKFAVMHHLCSEPKRFLYCFIPKNACTTFKTVTSQYSNDIVKSKIQELRDTSEIHNVQKVLQADPEQLMNESYFKFTVIRNPFLRLTSAYLDKTNTYLNKFLPSEPSNLPMCFKQLMINFHDSQSAIMSFQDFIQSLETIPSNQLDIHWRPQVDFLLYNSYDMYLQFENLKQDIPKLEKALDIKIPKQNVAKHTTPYAYLDVGEPWKLHGEELWQIRQSQNAVPLPYQMYNDELITKVRELYKQDIELYENLFGVSAEAMLKPSH